MRELKLDYIYFAELAATVLDRGGSFCFKARGGSMRPFVLDNDMLTIAPVDNSSLKWGDILLYAGVDGTVVVHRLVGGLAVEGAGRKMRSGQQGFIGERRRESDGRQDVASQSAQGSAKLLLCGDAYRVRMEEVARDRILGKVVEVRRGGKIVPLESFFYRFLVIMWVKTAPLSSYIFIPLLRCCLVAARFLRPGRLNSVA